MKWHKRFFKTLREVLDPALVDNHQMFLRFLQHSFMLGFRYFGAEGR